MHDLDLSPQAFCAKAKNEQISPEREGELNSRLSPVRRP